MTTWIPVGVNLMQLRTAAKLTQDHIAKYLGVSQTAVHRYEWGEAEAPYRVLLLLADYYDVSLDYIFGRTEKINWKAVQGKFSPKLKDKRVI